MCFEQPTPSAICAVLRPDFLSRSMAFMRLIVSSSYADRNSEFRFAQVAGL